ncbi:hypothetical protein QT992_21390 [Microcoleus sp. T3_D1]
MVDLSAVQKIALAFDVMSQLPSIKRSTAGDVGLYLSSTAIPRIFAESQL